MSPRVLMVASECVPFVKVGGLADVLGALPRALRRVGVDARILLPGYDRVRAALPEREPLRAWPDLMGGGPARLLRGEAPGGVPLYVLDQPARFAGLADPYDPRPDLPRRFAALAWAGASVAREGDGTGWSAQVLHAHDWPAGLAPAYLALGPEPRLPTLMTLHNLAFQGRFDPAIRSEVGLPPEAYAMEGAEFHGTLSFLKAGLHYATKLSTVSPTYAREIQTPEGGMGMEGLLAWRSRDLVGILNGVDRELWDPARDPALAAPFDATHLPARASNKGALQADLGLDPGPEAPLLGLVSRMDPHKGLALLLAAAPTWLAAGGQLAVLGSGDPALEAAFRALRAAHPGRVAVRTGFDEALAHRMFAGVDLLAVPSLREPCGLTQLYALRYGALPLVRRTGGLADTVVDATEAALAEDQATGFAFDAPTAEALTEALARAMALWRQPDRWARVQRRAMAQDFGWETSARRYAALFEAMV